MSDNQLVVSIGKRGELVIPSSLRKSKGLTYGSDLIISLEGDSLVLTPKNYASFLNKWKTKRSTASKTQLKKDTSDREREEFLTKILTD